VRYGKNGDVACSLTEHTTVALEQRLEELGLGLERLDGGVHPVRVHLLGSGQALLDALQGGAVAVGELRHLLDLLHHGGVGCCLRIAVSWNKNKDKTIKEVKKGQDDRFAVAWNLFSLCHRSTIPL
jgi:hypothetical protein